MNTETINQVKVFQFYIQKSSSKRKKINKIKPKENIELTKKPHESKKRRRKTKGNSHINKIQYSILCGHTQGTRKDGNYSILHICLIFFRLVMFKQNLL